METVLNIYTKLNQINITSNLVKTTLNSLSEKLLSSPHSGTKVDLQANVIKTPLAKSKTVKTPILRKPPCQPNEFPCTISRFLQPKKLAMLIGNTRLNYNKWNSRRSIELSLSQFLDCKLTDINIVDLHWLPSASFYKRVILSFGSNRLPYLLMKKQNSLRNFSIFPTRVFADSEPLPLCSSGVFVALPKAPSLAAEVSRKRTKLTLYAKESSKNRIFTPSYACSAVTLAKGPTKIQKLSSSSSIENLNSNNPSTNLPKKSTLLHHQHSQGFSNSEAAVDMDLDLCSDPQQINSSCDPLPIQTPALNTTQPTTKCKNQHDSGGPSDKADDDKQSMPADLSLMLPHLLNTYNNCDMILQTPSKACISLSPQTLYNNKSLAQELSEAGDPSWRPVCDSLEPENFSTPTTTSRISHLNGCIFDDPDGILDQISNQN